MDKNKKKFIAEQVSAIVFNFQADTTTQFHNVSGKRIRIFCDYNDMTDQQIMANLHSIKLDLVDIGKKAYEAVEAIKKHIDSNPDQPDLPLTNEDLQDDNPVEGIDY